VSFLTHLSTEQEISRHFRIHLACWQVLCPETPSLFSMAKHDHWVKSVCFEGIVFQRYSGAIKAGSGVCSGSCPSLSRAGLLSSTLTHRKALLRVASGFLWTSLEKQGERGIARVEQSGPIPQRPPKHPVGNSPLSLLLFKKETKWVSWTKYLFSLSYSRLWPKKQTNKQKKPCHCACSIVVQILKPCIV
jgi:hypothetical protein